MRRPAKEGAGRPAGRARFAARRAPFAAALLAAALALAGCGSSPSAGAGAAGAAGDPPEVVRARCGGCHALPVPDPLRDDDAVRRSHEKRMRLSPGESAEAFGWLSGAVR